MAQWEHAAIITGGKSIRVDYWTLEGPSVRIEKINKYSSRHDEINQLIARMGAEGWEIFQAHRSMDGDEYWLKRQL